MTHRTRPMKRKRVYVVGVGCLDSGMGWDFSKGQALTIGLVRKYGSLDWKIIKIPKHLVGKRVEIRIVEV